MINLQKIVLERCKWGVHLDLDEDLNPAMNELKAHRAFDRVCRTIAVDALRFTPRCPSGILPNDVELEICIQSEATNPAPICPSQQPNVRKKQRL